MPARLKAILRKRLSPSLKLSAKRFFVSSVGIAVRVSARVVNLVDRLLLTATTHGLDFDHAWNVKGRPKAPLIQPWGAREFLLLMEGIAGREDAPLNPDRPVRTSIILICYNKIEYTFQCLRSLLREIDLVETEIIVVDNGSRDETARVLSYFRNFIRVVTIEENAGFLDACNLGARAGRGKYLVLLNNDIEVLPGWLAALLETVDGDPEVGAVGPMYVYPNGILQEAGSIVWKDASAAHYGWGQSPENKRYNFAREVDYCSAAAFLIRKEIFDKLDGLDPRYKPAFYEEVDLCFGVRSLGYKVIYQPRARAIHHEGITLGVDVKVGPKRFQVINQQKFYEKWREYLEREHYDAATTSMERASDRRRPGLLICDDRIPTPDRDAGSARMFFILKSLARWSRPVFVSTSKPEWPEYEKRLWQVGVETANAAGLGRLLKNRKYQTAVVSRPEVAEVLIPWLRRHDPNMKIVFDMVDTHFIRLEREYAISGEAHTAREAKRYRKLETRMARLSNLIWCASSEDKRVMEREVPGKRIEVIPTIHELHGRGKPFEERADLLFVGNLAHRPNSDGIHFLMKDIFPLIQASLPNVKLHIVGDNASPEILAYASDSVRVTGYVADIGPLFENCRVFVAPVRFGAGIKGKVGEAMSYGVPVVTTAMGAEGFSLENEANAMIAETPADFAAAVTRLYSEKPLWQTLAENSHRHIEQHFTPEIIARMINQSIREVSGLEK
jgi:GT2 family glycosyltransferase